MAEVSPDPAPPPIIDPALENLNVDQLAQLVNAISPDVFYQRAQAFDTAAARLQDVRDAFRRAARQLQEAWSGKIAESFEGVAQEFTGTVTNVLQPLQDPGYGTRLRQAGDALATAQHRLQDFQTQKTQQAAAPPVAGALPPDVVEKGNQLTVLQIVHDLCTAYRDIGTTIAPLPESRHTPGGKAGGDIVVGTDGSGGGPINVRHYPAALPPGDGVIDLPLSGDGGVLVPRGDVDGSFSGGPNGAHTPQGGGYLPVSGGPGGALGGPGGGHTPRGEVDMSVQGGPGGARGDGGMPLLLAPGAIAYPGESTIGRGKSAGAGPVDESPVTSGAFPVWVESARPVLGQRKSASAVPETAACEPVVDGLVEGGVLGRRQFPGEPGAECVLGRQAVGTPPSQQRRVAAKTPKSGEKPVTESEHKDRPLEEGNKEVRPATVSRAVGDSALPVAHAGAGAGGVPPASAVPPVTALPVMAGSAHQVVDTAGIAAASQLPALPTISIERGLHVPDPGAAAGGAPQAVLPVRALPAEGSSALAGAYPMTEGTPGSGAAPGAAPATGHAPMEGAPMAPMGMGGMGGMQQQESERTSEIVPGPDPDVWDYSNGAPAALGKPEPPPAEPVEIESPQDAWARIMERRS